MEELPEDILRKVGSMKIKEINDIKDIFKEEIKKNWYKYCNCVNCKARRARILHYVEGYNEAFEATS